MISVLYLLTVVIASVQGQSVFIRKPDDRTLGAVGGSVQLPWVYFSNSSFTFMKWFRTNDQNEPLENLLLYAASDGNPNVLEPRAIYNGSSRIILQNLKLSDEGWIACTMDFSNGETLYSKIYLEIGTNPHSTNVPAQSFAVENGNETIECASIAKPRPYITWRDADQKELTNTSDYHIITMVDGEINQEVKVKSVLTIIGVERKDAGKFTCISKNDISSDKAESTLSVYYKPINTKLILQYAARLEGEGNVITCKADALPQPIHFEIYHGNKLVSNTTTGIYSMTRVNNYDEGDYKCIPKNWAGVGLEAVEKLTVEVKPTLFGFGSSEITAKEGDAVNIVCKINADPKPTITWNKLNADNTNNLNINTTTLHENSTLFQMVSFVKLTTVNRTDHGVYTCRAGNTVGEVTHNISLIVNYRPSIIFHTIEQPSFFINETGSKTITCSARGFPKPILKWYRNSVEIQNNKHTIINSIENTGENFFETKSIIILTLVTKHDAGNFSCEASNIAGKVSASSMLNVYYKPEIVAQMEPNSYVNLGTGLALSCVARGIEQPRFLWYKNDIQVFSGNGSVEIEDLVSSPPHVSSILSINPVQSSDANAVFKCVAKNSQGEDSKSTTFSVYFGPTIINFPAPSIVTSENKNNYKMSCVVQANPRPDIRWYTNGQRIIGNAFDSNYLIDEEVVTASTSTTVLKSTLIIKVVERGNFGNWTCRGSNTIVNDIYRETSNTTQLTVTYDPRFEFVSPNNFRRNITDTVIFTCRVKASPKPFVWWKLPSTITMDNRFSFSTTTIADVTQFGSVEAKLTVVNAGKRDHGNYMCLTNNTITSDSRTSKLIVQYKPSATADFADNTHMVSENSISSLEVVVDANPVATMEWFVSHDNGSTYKQITDNIEVIQIAVIEDFENKYKSRLLFPRGINRNDQGWYKVTISNLLGKIDKKTYLIVQWKPHAQTGLSGTDDVNKDQSHSLICRYLSNPINRIDWYKNGKLITNIQYSTETLSTNASISLTQSTLTVIQAQPGDQGNYTCTATNAIGQSHQWKYINVLYSPILQVSSEALMIDLSQKLTLSCGANANPKISNYEWMKNDVKLSTNSEQFTITNVDEGSLGNYSCTPSNELGNGSTVVYSVTIRTPPKFTKPAQCNRVNVSNPIQSYFVCTCEGTGTPKPEIFWTKYQTSSTVGTENVLNLTISASNDGTYYCNLKNSKATVQSSVQITYFVPPLGVWSLWGDCNVTCGKGFQSRNRACNIQPCDAKELLEAISCDGACTGQQSDQEENSWLYALYAIVPCAILLIVLAVIWISRLNRRNLAHQT